jgi:hypothetical protein
MVSPRPGPGRLLGVVAGPGSGNAFAIADRAINLVVATLPRLIGQAPGPTRGQERGSTRGCSLLVMGRIAGVLNGVGLLAFTLAMAGGARAAGDVVISASPSEVRVGQPLEILVRTFLPIQREGTLAVPDPREPYPGPSAFWNVLYPWDDYPFRVVAQHEDGTEVAVAVARDPADSTLWRGTVFLPKAGAWTVWVRNFQGKEPGSTTAVLAEAAAPASLEAGPAALIGAILGVLAGIGVALSLKRLPSWPSDRAGT